MFILVHHRKGGAVLIPIAGITSIDVGETDRVSNKPARITLRDGRAIPIAETMAQVFQVIGEENVLRANNGGNLPIEHL